MGSSGLTKHQLEIITNEVLKIQSKKQKEQKRVTRDWKLRNTNLLLKNYQMLKKHCDGIVPTLEEFEERIFNPEELNIEILMKYKARTKEMLDYFDLMVSSYCQYCHNQGMMAERRFDVIQRVYLFENEMQRMSKIQVAGLYNIDSRTVDRDIKKASEELSVFLFGIDSLDDLANVLFVS